MEKYFDILKGYFGTHKTACKTLGVSHSSYNKWKCHRAIFPKRAQNLIYLAAREIELTGKSTLTVD